MLSLETEVRPPPEPPAAAIVNVLPVPLVRVMFVPATTSLRSSKALVSGSSVSRAIAAGICASAIVPEGVARA